MHDFAELIPVKMDRWLPMEIVRALSTKDLKLVVNLVNWSGISREPV